MGVSTKGSKDMPAKKRVITAEEFKKHATNEDLWLLIDGKVYDVTKYQDEHPGSDSILHDVKGVDATQEFEDVGHSKDAMNVKDKLLIGDFDMETIDQLPGGDSKLGRGEGGGGSPAAFAIPVVVLMVILAIVFKVIPSPF